MALLGDARTRPQHHDKKSRSLEWTAEFNSVNYYGVRQQRIYVSLIFYVKIVFNNTVEGST